MLQVDAVAQPTTIVLTPDLRAALERVVTEVRVEADRFSGTAVGSESLRSEFERYFAKIEEGDTLVALGATESELFPQLERIRPARIVSLSASHISPVLSYLSGRTDPVRGPLSHRELLRAEYARTEIFGVHGLGSHTWGILEKVTRLINRDDLADIARFTSLRSMVTLKHMHFVARYRIDCYERVRL